VPQASDAAEPIIAGSYLIQFHSSVVAFQLGDGSRESRLPTLLLFNAAPFYCYSGGWLGTVDQRQLLNATVGDGVNQA